jgi:hypothetical protein
MAAPPRCEARQSGAAERRPFFFKECSMSKPFQEYRAAKRAKWQEAADAINAQLEAEGKAHAEAKVTSRGVEVVLTAQEEDRRKSIP